MKVLRHAVGPGSAPALGRVTRVLTLRLRMLVHWACVQALFLAGLGSVMGSVQATSLAFESSSGRCTLFARFNEELAGCAEALPLAFLIPGEPGQGNAVAWTARHAVTLMPRSFMSLPPAVGTGASVQLTVCFGRDAPESWRASESDAERVVMEPTVMRVVRGGRV